MFLLRILSHFCEILNRDENIVNFLWNSQYGCYGKVLYRAWLNRYKMLLQSLETSDISSFHFARRCCRDRIRVNIHTNLSYVYKYFIYRGRIICY